MADGTVSLAAGAVGPRLRGRFGEPYLWYPSCASTQDVLRGSGLPEGAVAVTEHQTDGRGRLGRRWDDRAGTSVLASVLLRPPATHALPQLSLVAGLAVAEAVEIVTGLEAWVKWPNDVLIAGRKTAGILVEGDDDGVVCGFGINITQTKRDLPAETRTPATSLRVATGRTIDRALVLAIALDRLEHRYDTWRHDGLGALVPLLDRRNALAGRTVRAGELTAVVDGIAPDGQITLIDANGAAHHVASGELELV
jgi:BirA family biotin operon repressor/biotin-[acetyl-CoA-carboxylase] ligase